MAPRLTRRAALLGLTSAFALGRSGLALAAAPTDRRFVVIILRGALDGLAAVVPYGDRNLAAWRAELVPRGPRRPRRAARSRRLLRAASVARGHARALPGGRAAAGARGRRPLPQPQPFRGAGLHGERRRPAHDQRLAQPRRRAAPRRRRAARPASPSASPCRCCCAARPRSAPRRRRASPQPDPDLYARLVALNSPDPVTGPALAEGLKERDLRRSDARGRRRRQGRPQQLPGAGRHCRATAGQARTVRASRRWRSTAGTRMRCRSAGSTPR